MQAGQRTLIKIILSLQCVGEQHYNQGIIQYRYSSYWKGTTYRQDVLNAVVQWTYAVYTHDYLVMCDSCVLCSALH